MQKFTRFYGKVAYLGMISDFSTSLRFLFCELISGFQILISVISLRAYEISPSVGPLGPNRLKSIMVLNLPIVHVLSGKIVAMYSYTYS